MSDDENCISFVGRRLPSPFELRQLVLAPGATRAYDAAEWRGALVVVEEGAVELECTRGGRRRFLTGAVMYLGGIPLRSIHNADAQPAVLVTVTRRVPGRTAFHSQGFPPPR